jgi:hypothetical protein
MPDDGWIRWLCDLVEPGADALGVEVIGEPVRGLGNRSVGCRVATPNAQRWMRIITEPTQWAGGPAWTGNTDANAITSVAKPVVLNLAEWDESGRRIRAELMTLAPGTQISADMVLRQHIDLDHRWWRELRSSLDALATFLTDRVCIDELLLQRRLLAAFGLPIDVDTLVWSTAHGDVHWANLTAPQCWVLDWESWGRGPAGYDAALLLCVSLLEPDTAASVHTAFADILDTPTGYIAQLADAAKLLGLVEHGEHPDLAIPLHRHAHHIIDTL